VIATSGEGYAWLADERRPGAYMQVASCFAFYLGIPVGEVVTSAGLLGARTVDLRDDPDPLTQLPDNRVAVLDGGDGWTIV
jgi:hypothetical protein